MAQLSKQTKAMCGFVTWREYSLDDVDRFQTAFIDFLKGSCKEYHAIWHLLDTHDDGSAKTEHIHFVAILPKKKRVGTFIREISKACNVSREAVTCEPMGNYVLSVQYLIHKNNKEKYQYPLDDVMSSLDVDDLKEVMESDGEMFDIDTLINIVASCDTKTQIMQQIGLGKYRAYRPVINDIFEECHLITDMNGKILNKKAKRKNTSA